MVCSSVATYVNISVSLFLWCLQSQPLRAGESMWETWKDWLLDLSACAFTFASGIVPLYYFL